MNRPKRDRRRDQHVYVDDLRVGDVIYDNTGEATVVSVSDIDQRGYRNIEVAVNGGRKTFRYYGESTVPIKRRAGGVREGHRVADFNTLDDLLEHARQEGATHYLQIDDETHLYFKRRDGRYEKSEVWQKDGYWHTQGPGSRAVVARPPSNARPIGANVTRLVRDYEAVDNHDRVIAGPFKSYGDARNAAGPADHVRFVPAKRSPPRASEARGERQFEVVNPDGRVISHITAPTIERAQDDLARGKNAGWYPRGSRIKGARLDEKREAIAKRFRVGSRVMMSPDALENYGERWQGIGFIVTHVSTSHDDHPGYDSSSGSALYDLKIELSGEPFGNSLYDWELVPEPPSMKHRRREPVRETRSAHNPIVGRRVRRR